MAASPHDAPPKPSRPPLTRLEIVTVGVLALALASGIGVGLFRATAGAPDVRLLLGEDRGETYRIPLNHAAVEELTLVPGIGQVRAERIVAHRDRHGPFRSFGDVAAVSGISRKLALAIADYCTLEER